MRLWSLPPSLLDRAALIACWREALLAQSVLAGRTRGYKAHPQLTRFRATGDPMGAIGWYLSDLRREAGRRGYSFNGGLVLRPWGMGEEEGEENEQLAQRKGSALGKRKRALDGAEANDDQPLPHEVVYTSTDGPRIPVTTGQIKYELSWLLAKVRKRSPDWVPRLVEAQNRVQALCEGREGEGGEGIDTKGWAEYAGSTFVIVPGDVEEWEKVPVTEPKKANRGAGKRAVRTVTSTTGKTTATRTTSAARTTRTSRSAAGEDV